MTRLNKIAAGSLAALALVPAAGMAAAQDGPKELFLGKTSGGAALDWNLERTPRSQSVTIDGSRARVKLIDSSEGRLYRAFVNRNGFRAGRKYTVVVRVKGRDGENIVKRSRLTLHRSMNR